MLLSTRPPAPAQVETMPPFRWLLQAWWLDQRVRGGNFSRRMGEAADRHCQPARSAGGSERPVARTFATFVCTFPPSRLRANAYARQGAPLQRSSVRG